MRIVLTGATGFIGRAVVLRLLREGHELTALVRDRERARGLLGPEPALVELGPETPLSSVVSGHDAVVNLAGEPVVAERWTAARRAALTESRAGLTRTIVEAMRQSALPPRTLISASAVGYYGAHRDEPTDEQAEAGDDFLATLCQAWEREALAAEAFGARVLRLRIGLVLGREGGFLGPMLPWFRSGLGGPIGRGRAAVPWIHIDDVAEVVCAALGDERYAGVLNLTAPGSATNAELARSLGRVLSRPAALPVPPFALRVAFGQAAEAIVGGVAAVPAGLVGLGYPFRFSSLDAALEDVLETSAVQIEPARDVPSHEYLHARRPTHLLTVRDVVAAPIGRLYPFFESPENLGLLTPPWMSFRIETPRPIEIGLGTSIDYRIRLGGSQRKWRTVIEHWEPPRCFVDAQHVGPYRCWWHEHRFAETGTSTEVIDRVYFAVPFGPLGRLVGAGWVEKRLRQIFAYRRWAMRLRFGVDGDAPGSSPARAVQSSSPGNGGASATDVSDRAAHSRAERAGGHDERG